MFFPVAFIAAALGATPPGPEHQWHVGSQLGRDNLLATPAPYPPDRTDDVRRTQNSRLWVSRSPVGSRTPIEQRTWSEPGLASYGASPSQADRVVFVRVDQTSIAIDPWSKIEGGGDLADMEHARNVWLREQGYVLKVRTHVNERANARNAKHADAGSPEPDTASPELRGIPHPRAIIRMERDEPHPKIDRMRVQCPKVVEPTQSVATAG